MGHSRSYTLGVGQPAGLLPGSSPADILDGHIPVNAVTHHFSDELSVRSVSIASFALLEFFVRMIQTCQILNITFMQLILKPCVTLDIYGGGFLVLRGWVEESLSFQ